jgi:hypothetical protein
MDMTENKTKREAGKIGGARRAEILPPKRRTEIAQKAAIARWKVKLPQATHTGNFKNDFGIDVECYVLDDTAKTAVISQTGLARALGLSPRSNSLPRFLSSKAMMSADAGLAEKIENPLKFQWGTGGAGIPPSLVHGFNVTLLIDICNAIIKAEAQGGLKEDRYRAIAAQAHIIVGASAKAGIQGLVYRLAGYNPTAEEVISAFKAYVQEEAKRYEPQFDDALYAQWYRLYDIPRPDRGRPWHFKYLTVNHVYFPLAKSAGRILELLRANKAAGGDRTKKLFQFLNEIGTIALSRHLGRVQEIAEDSADKWEYEARIAKRFGFEQQLELPIPLPPPASKEAAH